MFLYGIGIQYGRQFVGGLSGAAGRRANLLALLGLAAGVVAALAAIAAGLPTAYVTGLFAGAMTSTAALQAAIDAAASRDPAVGYSVAYPLGVIGPILCMYLFQIVFVPRSRRPGPKACSISRSGSGTRRWWAAHLRKWRPGCLRA
jgi:putative transport protein